MRRSINNNTSSKATRLALNVASCSKQILHFELDLMRIRDCLYSLRPRRFFYYTALDAGRDKAFVRLPIRTRRSSVPFMIASSYLRSVLCLCCS